MNDIEYEVYADDLFQASATELGEAMNYALQYAEDGGKIEVFKVVSNRELVAILNDDLMPKSNEPV